MSYLWRYYPQLSSTKKGIRSVYYGHIGLGTDWENQLAKSSWCATPPSSSPSRRFALLRALATPPLFVYIFLLLPFLFEFFMLVIYLSVISWSELNDVFYWLTQHRNEWAVILRGDQISFLSFTSPRDWCATSTSTFNLLDTSSLVSPVQAKIISRQSTFGHQLICMRPYPASAFRGIRTTG